MQFFAGAPVCCVILDDSGKAVGCNDTFEEHMGPLWKFANLTFCDGGSGNDDAKLELSTAVKKVRDGDSKREVLKNVEMLTLAGEAGMPIRRHFDWNVGNCQDGILVCGEPCTEQVMEERAKDAELVDFFQNAPIALHWLSGEGIVLWANNTELNVLGYTAEEYIGQPIMKFCPDEEELVLEIFKTLGSGNIIKDVPVRFRTKDGRIVPLLIDSNVNYKTDGSFNHTRCFIRDDTGRRVREARADALLHEMQRSLTLLDNFMSNTIHFVRTPCQVLQASLEEAESRIEQVMEALEPEEDKDKDKDKQTGVTTLKVGKNLVSAAMNQLGALTRTLDDVSDLQRFEQGAAMAPVFVKIELVKLGRTVMAEAAQLCFSNVECVLEISEGPPNIVTDAKQLRRVLNHLLRNAATATLHGSVHLSVQYNPPAPKEEVLDGSGSGSGSFKFTVRDTGCGMKVNSVGGSDSGAFEKYHMPSVVTKPRLGRNKTRPNEEEIKVARSMQEDATTLSSASSSNGLGVGLSLSYNIVNSLGGELCFDSTPGDTKFFFTLPARDERQNGAADEASFAPPVKQHFASSDRPENGEFSEMSTNWDTIASSTNADTAAFDPWNTVSTDGSGRPSLDMSSMHNSLNEVESAAAEKNLQGPAPSLATATATVGEAKTVFQKLVGPDEIASRGLAALEPPHVLIVEDTAMCYKVLRMSLQKLKCTVDVAENGEQAIEAVRKAKEEGPRRYNLILMDLRMPVMDGFEATRVLKQEMGVKTPIVALTAETGSGVRKQCEDLEFEEFLQKPLKGEVLKQILAKFTGHVVK